MGERLAGHPIDAIYVTSLRRTAETAGLPLAARLGIEPKVEADLREVHLASGKPACSARRRPSGTRWRCG